MAGWALWGLVLAIPIHLALGIRLSSIALFLGIQCALQMSLVADSHVSAPSENRVLSRLMAAGFPAA